MMRLLTLSCFGTLLLTASLQMSSAVSLHADEAIEDYVSSQGYQQLDLAQWTLAENLDAALTDIGLARKDADLTSIEKALLVLDLGEEPLTRVRYAIRLGASDQDNVPLTFLQIDRYNLGPAIWSETVAAYGEDQTAPQASFGLGPHVSWRFVTQPTAKAAAIILSAGRREIPEEQAASLSCFGQSCLSLQPPGEILNWEDVSSAPLSYPEMPYSPVIVSEMNGEPVEEEAPAHVALELAAALGLASVTPEGVLWTFAPPDGSDPDHPYAIAIIDRNLGQDFMTDAIMRLVELADGADELWVRRIGSAWGGVVQSKLQKAAAGPT